MFDTPPLFVRRIHCFGIVLFEHLTHTVDGIVALPLPELRHVLKRLTLGLGHQTPDEDGGDDADETVEAVGEPVAEVIALGDVHVEHRHEGGGDDEVEDPLEGHGHGDCLTTDGVGEYLGDEHPADGAPREHEACRIEE